MQTIYSGQPLVNEAEELRKVSEPTVLVQELTLTPIPNSSPLPPQLSTV